ncbi:MAG: homocysteine S-methyltransferase family protein [Thermoguttaceae bacterium]|jgi:5-methyltetrahydrofolate--homocysteine methyltransferase
MNETIATWLADGPLVLDGGLGTQLQLLGLPVGEAPDLWNLTNPEKVGEVAAAYAAAGSDIILTNTFGANRFLLARHGAADKVAEVNRRGVEIAKKAAAASGRPVRVFGSMGPTGIMLMMGQETSESLREAFQVQAEAMAAGGADGIAIETMSDPAEIKEAIAASKSTGLPVAASMTFGAGKKKDRTMMGTTPEQAVAVMTEAGADILGSNCGQGIDGFLPICRRYRAASDLPVWMKGNAGLPRVEGEKVFYDQTPEGFAAAAARLLEEGVSFLGGCCGTTPDYIRELRKLVDAWKESS